MTPELAAALAGLLNFITAAAPWLLGVALVIGLIAVLFWAIIAGTVFKEVFRR